MDAPTNHVKVLIFGQIVAIVGSQFGICVPRCMDDKYGKHIDKSRTDQPEGDDRDLEPGSLESAESHVARSTGPSDPGDASGEKFSAAFRALLEWGETASLIRPEEVFDFFRRPPDGYGDEHQAWFDESSNRWFKATYPNRFGLGWGSGDSATAGEYLSRLTYQNQYFADDIRLVALINSNQHLRILTSQPHIAGEAPSQEEIQNWFRELGFVRLVSEDRIAWFLASENLLIADAHEGNVIKTANGILVPIDLNIIKPRGDLRSWAVRQANSEV